CAPATVMRHASRLGRHALIYLHVHGPRGPLAEPVVGDGFESFAYSQYHPLHLNLIVGARSHFCYAFTHTELRRKGRMRAAQKRRRAQLEARYGRPNPRGIERGLAEALRLAAPEPQALTLRSDELAAYQRTCTQLRRRASATTHEPPPTREPPPAATPLSPVTRLDLLLRHNSAQHKRETIAFAKRHQAVVERGAWLILWQNFAKPFS